LGKEKLKENWEGNGEAVCVVKSISEKGSTNGRAKEKEQKGKNP